MTLNFRLRGQESSFTEDMQHGVRFIVIKRVVSQRLKHVFKLFLRNGFVFGSFQDLEELLSAIAAGLFDDLFPRRFVFAQLVVTVRRHATLHEFNVQACPRLGPGARQLLFFRVRLCGV